MIRFRRVAALVGAATLVTGAGLALGHRARGAAPLPPVGGIGINGLCGGVLPGSMPADLREGAAESPLIHVFTEDADIAVSGAVPVDAVNPGLYSKPQVLPTPKPSIPSGMHVNSYLLHSDPPGSATVHIHRAANDRVHPAGHRRAAAPRHADRGAVDPAAHPGHALHDRHLGHGALGQRSRRLRAHRERPHRVGVVQDVEQRRRGAHHHARRPARPRPSTATGCSRPTVACSTSAARSSSARPAARC